MIITRIRVDGLVSTKNYIRKVIGNINRIEKVYPIKFGRLIKTKFKNILDSETYPINPKRYGLYRRETGKGMADATRIYSIKKGVAILDLDPAQKVYGVGPITYFKYVEDGTFRSQPKRYLERAIIQSISEINNQTTKIAREIIQR